MNLRILCQKSNKFNLYYPSIRVSNTHKVVKCCGCGHIQVYPVDKRANEYFKETIEENLGQKINVFSYPFGVYNEEVTKLLKDSGYQAARDILNGVNHTNKDLYSLRAYFITENFSRFVNIVTRL